MITDDQTIFGIVDRLDGSTSTTNIMKKQQMKRRSPK